ncbi:oligosaccharide flippase family protein [Pseudoalteromonas sp. SA25]|uniref:lipopolysaccharide biosynthesis protein n=1 Tax=Pseudoalteromonas sp. SA25 TaxID=2686347 RepID=UPI0013FE36D9|nr:oligosaccharide flippase family protein [Pseudoalteromonas sp. SA25]
MKNLIPKSVFNNFINLSSIQVITVLVQIILYPFLINKIGADEYGKIILAQIIITYFQVFVVFGTDLAAISLVSGEKKTRVLSHSFSMVFWGRLVLSCIGAFLYILILLYSDIDSIFLFFIISIFEPAFTTRWYYHGREELSNFTVPLVLSRLLISIMIFISVGDESDRDIVIILLSFGYFLGVLLPFFLLRKRDIKIVKVKFLDIAVFFSSSFRLFLTNIISIAKDKTSAIIIGLAISYELLVYYEFAMKISNVLSSFLSSFSSSFYPKFCQKFDFFMYKKTSRLVFLFSATPLFFLVLFPKQINEIIFFIMGVSLDDVVSVFYFFGLLIFVRGHSYFMGLCCLMANKQNKDYTETLIYSSLLFFILIIIMLSIGTLTMGKVCLAYSIALVFEYFHRLFKCNKYLSKVSF